MAMFKTNNITAIEYYRYNLIICIEYEDINNKKFLEVIKSDEFQNNISHIFSFDNIPSTFESIYNYSKTVSKFTKENNIYYIHGQKIHKRDNKYYKLLYDEINPFEISSLKINSKNTFYSDYINEENSKYFENVLNTIKLKCY